MRGGKRDVEGAGGEEGVELGLVCEMGKDIFLKSINLKNSCFL